VLFIFKTGSALFCSNSKDYDYKVVVSDAIEGGVKMQYDPSTNQDYIIINQDHYKQLISFDEMKLRTIYAIDIIFSDTSLVYGSKTLDPMLLHCSAKYKNMLRTVLPKSLLDKRVTWEGSDKYCHRHLWWVIMGLKFINNNSYEVTPELREIIQLCHDGKLDKSWEQWVKKEINLQEE
jgi:hypothetical protein